MLPLLRSRLRDDIVDRLANLIATGELDRERLKEVELASQLGVSRTPLREALLILESEGLVVSEAHKGFRVAALSEARVRELYPILGALEGLAVRESGARLRARVGELRAVNASLRASRTKLRRHALDQRFHELLRDGCPNRALVELVRRLWLQAQRFDGATERGMADPAGSLRDHVAITDAIGRGDLAGAVARLDEHWRHGIDVVVRWLRTRGAAMAMVVAISVWGSVACGRPAPISAPPPKAATPANSMPPPTSTSGMPAGTAASAGSPGAGPSSATAVPALPDAQWGYFVDEMAIDLLVERWSREHQPHAAAIEHVSVVSMAHPGIDRDQTVIIDDGRLRAIGPSARVPVPAGATVIDGRGKYVMPGLVDMHTHTNLSDSHYLLDLANGVTSVREMDGHPFLLRQRAEARANRLLIPNLYVAGKILASQPLEWYATVVTTPEAARAAVRDQKAAGYEFIKVHNLVLPEVYDAICAEARAQGLDVVGHIPHQISIAHAIACGQRTFEHFKGYILDRSLTLTGEDYVAATRSAPVWNTPTFYMYRAHLRGDEARTLVTTLPEMRYVPARDRARWLALADEPARPIQQNVLPLSEKIFRDLLPIHARFVAGTDSGGGYPYHVPGFSLHEELRIMARNGMPIAEVLRTATVEPAIAMRRQTELGTLEVGRRADLVLLARNPLEGIDNLAAIDERTGPAAQPGPSRAIEGVMVRGVWLSRVALDDMLAAIQAIDRGRRDPAVSPEELERTLSTLEQLRTRGYVLRDHFLGWLRFRMEAAHLPVSRPLFDGIAALQPDED
jgi:DNA-binding GntR family transcriptional regulator